MGSVLRMTCAEWERGPLVPLTFSGNTLIGAALETENVRDWLAPDDRVKLAFGSASTPDGRFCTETFTVPVRLKRS
jgi:hypothetical protein